MADGRLTVLGRYGAYPAPGGAGRGYLLQTGGHTVLVGCGSGVCGRLGWMLPDPGALDAILLPDLRPDHCADLWSIGSLAACAVAAGRRRGLLPVYAYGEPEAEWRRLNRPGVLDVRRFAAEDTLLVGGWTLTCVRTDHAWPGVALRAEEPDGAALAVVTLGALHAGLAPALRGAALLLAEVGGPQTGFDEGLDGGMDAVAAAQLAASVGARRLLLAHLHPDDAEGPAAVRDRARTVFVGTELALESRTYDVG